MIYQFESDGDGGMTAKSKTTNLLAELRGEDNSNSNGNGNGNGNTIKPLTTRRKRPNAELNSYGDSSNNSSQNNNQSQESISSQGSVSSSQESTTTTTTSTTTSTTTNKQQSLLSKKKQKVDVTSKAHNKKLAAKELSTKSGFKGALSIDQILKDRKLKAHDPLMSLDAFEQSIDEKKKQIEMEEEAKRKEMEQLEKAIEVKVDVGIEHNPSQISLRESSVPLPKVLLPNQAIPSDYQPVNESDALLVEILKKSTNDKALKTLIQNGLQTIVECYNFDTPPNYLINLLLSTVSFERDGITVHKAHNILLDIIKRSNQIVIPFSTLFEIFKTYKIDTQQSFNIFTPSTDTSVPILNNNSMQIGTSHPIPFTNIYYILVLLNEQIKKQNTYNNDELKHIALFILLLGLDPNYLKDFKVDESKRQSIQINAIILQTILLLKSMSHTLINLYLGGDNSKILPLFHDIWSSIDKNQNVSSIALLTSYNLPHQNDLQRKFALYSIMKILKQENIEDKINLTTKTILEKAIEAIKPYATHIKKKFDIIMMTDLIVLLDMCSCNRLEFMKQANTFNTLLTKWGSKIQDTRGATGDFAKMRVKDLLIVIQNKIASLVPTSQSLVTDFFTVVTPESNVESNGNNHHNNTSNNDTNNEQQQPSENIQNNNI